MLSTQDAMDCGCLAFSLCYNLNDTEHSEHWAVS